MSDIILFISFEKIQDLDSASFVTAVKKVTGVVNIQFIENDIRGKSQFEIDMDILNRNNINDLYNLLLSYCIKDFSGLAINFSQQLSGTSDPYGASGISMEVERMLTSVPGVIKAGISPSGTIRVELVPDINKLQMSVDEILIVIKQIKTNNV